jgi:hypothetical protein
MAWCAAKRNILKKRTSWIGRRPSEMAMCSPEQNTVVNAFHIRALHLMAEMGKAIGRTHDSDEFAAREAKARAAFQERFFDAQRGLYRDGVGTDHASLHANLFPLEFGLVPEANRLFVAEWLAERGMKCSVYAAQYLLEGLFENGQGRAAIELMVASGDRSWRHMVESARRSLGRRGIRNINRTRTGVTHGAQRQRTCCRAMFWESKLSLPDGNKRWCGQIRVC